MSEEVLGVPIKLYYTRLEESNSIALIVLSRGSLQSDLVTGGLLTASGHWCPALISASDRSQC